MRTEHLLPGVAAVGMTIAIALIFNTLDSTSFSGNDSNIKSFNVEPTTEIFLKQQVESSETIREVRVIYPSPYEGVSRRSSATAR